MIDLNMWEIAGLIGLAVILFGPEKLPELARKAARIIAYLRRVGNDARSQLRAELGPEFDDIRLSDLNPKTFVQRHLLSGDEVEDLRQIRQEALDAGALARQGLDDVTATVADAANRAEPAASVVHTVPFDPEAT